MASAKICGSCGRRNPAPRYLEDPHAATPPVLQEEATPPNARMHPSDSLRFHRHVAQLRSITKERKQRIGEVIETALVLLSRHSFPQLTCDPLTYSPKLANHTAVSAFADWLAELDFLDAAYWLSSAYSRLCSEALRSNLAMYFTPPALTQRLLDDIAKAGINFRKASFMDPACGGAAFLAPIASRMVAMLRAKGTTPAAILKHISQHLIGVELDPVLCRLSAHFLRMVLAPEILATGKEPVLQVIKGNSLTELDQYAHRVDVVVCNPPYRKMARKEVDVYRERFDEIIKAQPNLYAFFIVLCLRLVKKRGVVGLVTPTSFLSGQSFSMLRSYLMRHTRIEHIGVVSGRSGVFIKVEQETAITLLRPRERQYSAETMTQVMLVDKDGQSTAVGQCLIPNSGNVWPIPRQIGDAEVVQLMNASPYRLVDYGYRARIGTVVWNRDKRQTFMTQSDAKKAVGSNYVALLWSSDIQANRRIQFPNTHKAHDEHCFITVASVEADFVIRRDAVLLQRVTSNGQVRRLIAAAVPSSVVRKYRGFVGENHTVILEAQAGAALSAVDMAELISTHLLDRYFRCIAGSSNVAVFELSQLPLPDPACLTAAIAQGLEMEQAVAKAFHEGSCK